MKVMIMQVTVRRYQVGDRPSVSILKKVVKLIAVVVGLFIAGLAYPQYQQIAYFETKRIKCPFCCIL
jgi:hypothetical protein